MMANVIKPGNFGTAVPADTKRVHFDFYNEQLIENEQKIDYLFIGDSITEHWNLRVYFKTDKYIENRGIGGDCSHYLLKRFDADCIQLAPKCVILMIGTNDILKTHDDLWWRTKGADEETVFSEYKDNVREMVKKCDAAGIELIICSVPPSTIAPPFDREKQWRLTEKMNSFLKTLDKTYVDYHSVLTSDGKNIVPEYTMDGIHQTPAAYTAMANKLKEYIEL